jgi:hypothetical protein
MHSDFNRLFAQFHNGNFNLEYINGSYITLIPKKDAPLIVNDYIPISLLNNSLKLQKVIQSVAHLNQYGFIKGRTIQDCLAWTFQFLHICHKSKREIVILKLDFENTFDLVEHEVILQMLQAKGFPNSWTSWIKDILSSGSSQVLLNGVPGKFFKCKRGVTLGDPLSPLPFVLVADLLVAAISG